MNAGEKVPEVRPVRVETRAHGSDFERKAHHDVRRGERIGDEPGPARELRLQIIEVKGDLTVDETSRRPAQRPSRFSMSLQSKGGIAEPSA